MLFGLTAIEVVWVVFAFGLGSWAQTVSGFGFALITVPLLTVVCTRIDSVVAQSVVGLFVTTYLAWKLRADVDRTLVSRVIPASVIGMPVGIVVGHLVSDRILRMVLGLSVIGAATAIATGWRVRGNPKVVDVIAGGVSGVLSTTTGTSGPPVVIAMAGRDLAQSAMRSSLQWIFLVGNVVAMALFALDSALTREGLGVGLIGLAPAILVRRNGDRMFHKLRPEQYRKLVLVMLFIAGAIAVLTALTKK